MVHSMEVSINGGQNGHVTEVVFNGGNMVMLQRRSV